MEKYFRFYFWLNSDQGRFLVSLVSYSLKSAKEALIKMENCPDRAVEFSSKKQINL